MTDTETPREFESLQEQDPWEDSDWLPSDTKILFPQDELTELMLEQPVSSVAVSRPAMIGPDDTMQDALFRMRQRHARALLVMEDDRLIGILTDRDFLNIAGELLDESFATDE